MKNSGINARFFIRESLDKIVNLVYSINSTSFNRGKIMKESYWRLLVLAGLVGFVLAIAQCKGVI